MSPNQEVKKLKEPAIKERKRDKKAGFKQVNYMGMLNEIIDEKFMDDKMS